MITYDFWKALINDIKQDISPFGEFLLSILITPILIVFDILAIPIELLYLVYIKIKGSNDNEKRNK